jgi:hydroxylysine kinase
MNFDLILSLVSSLDHVDLWTDDHDVSAILDYGDCAHGPYIFEIAIAMTYLAISKTSDLHPETTSGYALAGYLSQVSLTDKEVNLIQLCMCARIAQSLVIGAYSYNADPGLDYALDSVVKGWPVLRHLRAALPNHVLAVWSAIASECKETLNHA